MAVDPPPELIPVAGAGVVLRRHRLVDVDALHAVIEESCDHLRPFMPWADQARAQTAAFVSRVHSEWEAGTSFGFLVTAPATSESPEQILGGIGLRDRGAEGSFEIGYWLSSSATGRGTMTASAQRLTAMALAIDGIATVEIHCDEANEKSAAVPRRLGYDLVRIEPRAITAPGQHGREMVWVRRAPSGTADAS